MSTESSDHSSKQDLWSFIKHTKSTQCASLKLLQQFMLTLNRKELRHLIECYLKSKLSSCNPEGLTIKQSAIKILNNTANHTLPTIDRKILSKMHQNYGNKYHKKIITKLQQKKQEKKHILAIHPEVLAYSFQYLSYKELCKIQTICVYFPYLTKMYPGLAHYYIKLDKKLFCRAFRNKINVNNLLHFKHIEINHAYHNRNDYNYNINRQTQLFRYLLKMIINQSKSSLDILTIDIPMINSDPNEISTSFNVLLYIMNQYQNLLITNLIHWRSFVGRIFEIFFFLRLCNLLI